MLRFTHQELDFWVDVRLREFGGRWLAVADLAGEPDIGLGTSAEEAVRGALVALGEPFASQMSESLGVDDPRWAT